jgi:hypothetical protein
LIGKKLPRSIRGFTVSINNLPIGFGFHAWMPQAAGL